MIGFARSGRGPTMEGRPSYGTALFLGRIQMETQLWSVSSSAEG